MTYSFFTRSIYIFRLQQRSVRFNKRRAPLSARCFVSHKIVDFYYILSVQQGETKRRPGDSLGRIKTRVWQFLLNCHVRHVLEWSWLKSRRRKRYETTAFSKPWASLLVELPEKFSLSALGKNHDPMAVNRCWLRILEFQLAAAPLPE